MKKIIFSTLAIALMSGYTTQAQSVGINTDGSAAHSSAILDVKTTDKGVLIPRVALTATNTAAPVVTPATSLMVYNTNTAGDVTPGFYFWNGTTWVRVQSGTVPISSGGTGQTTANTALNALLPAQASQAGKVLQTDGTNTSWATAGVPASGIVISETQTNATLTSAGFTLLGSTTQDFLTIVATPTWTATTTVGAPSARGGHSIIWTGTEMIVWGGSATNTGGRYNPSTNAWTATSTGTNVPVARERHTAVWTGNSMIIWGGSIDGTGTNLTNTGGRYDPTTDTWTATSTTSVPTARDGFRAIWTGTEMIVWGGLNSSSTNLNTGGRYNPTTDTWTATSTTSVPTARDTFTAIWTGTEMIVWGGRNSSGTLFNTGGRYNPSTNTWTATSTGANVPTARTFHMATWTGREMIIWGGGDGGGNNLVNTGGRYNPTTDTWIATSTTVGVPTARRSSSVVWTGTEMIIWSGVDGGIPNTGGRYNPTTNTWVATSTTNAPSGRQLINAIWTGTEMIVWGGGSNTGGRLTNSGNSNKTLYYFKKN